MAQKGGFLGYNALLGDGNTLSAYTPTLREKTADWLRTKLFSDDRAGQDKANRLTNVMETMIPPFGVATQAYEAGRAGGMGDYGTAGLLGAMAMMPGLKTRGGKSILPTETGWVFKDVKSPNRIMNAGDWRLSKLLDPQEVELPIGSLNATQKTVNPDFASPITQTDQLPFVIKKNGEYYVQDGHHRLTKTAMDGRQTGKVRLVDLDGTTQTDFPLLDAINIKSRSK